MYSIINCINNIGLGVDSCIGLGLSACYIEYHSQRRRRFYMYAPVRVQREPATLY